ASGGALPGGGRARAAQADHRRRGAAARARGLARGRGARGASGAMSALAYTAARVVTCDGAPVDDGAGGIDAGKIAWVGPRAALAAGIPVDHLGARVVTPGLVDAHTHAAWVGSRHAEYAVRMAGGDYRAIAAAGGGILASHRATVAASEDE